MSFEQHLADNTAALKALTAILAGANLQSLAAAAVDKPKEAAKAEAPKSQAPAAKPAPASTPPTAEQSAAPAEKAASSEASLTYEVVANKIKQVHRDKGRDACVALLAKFNVTNGQQLKPEQWAECAKAADEVLAS